MTQTQIQALKTAQLWALLRNVHNKHSDQVFWVRCELRKRGYEV